MNERDLYEELINKMFTLKANHPLFSNRAYNLFSILYRLSLEEYR